MKIELGSGYQSEHGWLHVDRNPATNPHVVADVQHLPFRDGTFTNMRAVDILEHVSYWESQDVLVEWARVLLPGGQLFIQTPDAALIMHWYVTGNTDLLTRNAPPSLRDEVLLCAAWRLMGGHHDGLYVRSGDDWRWNAHYALFSHGLLCRMLSYAGLHVEEAQTNPFPNIQIWATRR